MYDLGSYKYSKIWLVWLEVLGQYSEIFIKIYSIPHQYMQSKQACRIYQLWSLLLLFLTLIAQTCVPVVAQVAMAPIMAVDTPRDEVLVTQTPHGYNVLSPIDSSVLYTELDTIYRGEFTSHFIVCSSNKWGLMDAYTGDLLIPTAYDKPPRRILTAENWIVTQGDKVGLYSLFMNAGLTIPPSMDNIDVVNYTMRCMLVRVMRNGLYGVYWTNGKELLPIVHTQIEGDTHYLTANYGAKPTIINVSTERVLDLDSVMRLTCSYYGDWLDPIDCVYLGKRGKKQGLLDQYARWIIPLGRHTITTTADGRVSIRKGRSLCLYTLSELKDKYPALNMPL